MPNDTPSSTPHQCPRGEAREVRIDLARGSNFAAIVVSNPRDGRLTFSLELGAGAARALATALHEHANRLEASGHA